MFLEDLTRKLHGGIHRELPEPGRWFVGRRPPPDRRRVRTREQERAQRNSARGRAGSTSSRHESRRLPRTVAWTTVVGLMLAGVLLDSMACGVLSLAGALTLFVVFYRSL